MQGRGQQSWVSDAHTRGLRVSGHCYSRRLEAIPLYVRLVGVCDALCPSGGVMPRAKVDVGSVMDVYWHAFEAFLSVLGVVTKIMFLV